MEREIKLKRKDGEVLKGKIKILDESYIDKIMMLQEEIMNGLTNKEWYSPSSREEFLIQITKIGKIVGCVLEDDRLAAIGAYVEWGYEDHNYGYDLDIKDKELLQVGQIEATIVHESFRGNGLQNKICTEVEKIAKINKNKVIAATVHPDNIYSLRTFQKLGYEIKKEKLKYGGLRRLILKKII